MKIKIYCLSEEFEDEIINDDSWLTEEPEEWDYDNFRDPDDAFSWLNE